MTGLYTGQAIGGFGATVAASYTWHTAFHWFGLIGIAYALLLVLCLRENPNHNVVKPNVETNKVEKESILKGFSALFSTVAFWIILFYFAAPSLPGWAIKNWLPTLFSENLNLPMAEAGPMSTITIALSSFCGVVAGGILSDRWVQRNIRGRIYISAIGLGLTIPALFLLGFGHNTIGVIAAGMLFGIGFGIFDANNMPILCQFVSPKYRATAYGIMNMTGVFAGAMVTNVLGKWSDDGNLGLGFALLSVVVAVAIALQLLFLKPKQES